MKKYIVMSAQERMPTTCWGNYSKVAVVELEPGTNSTPKMISERAKGIKRIVQIWRRLYVGKTDRCAFSRARAEAEVWANELNEGS